MNPATAPALPPLVLERMSRFQWLAIGICLLLNMLDGFDVMVMAFTAPHISSDWRLSGKALGIMFSAGLVGMALGSLLLAPLADRIGRRALILVCLGILTAGMALSALAGNAWQLGALRLFTGIGIGGMLVSVAIIAAEYASPRWRSTAVALQAIGYPLGAVLGGLGAARMLQHGTWHWVFLCGALASLLSILVVLKYLPESLDFLLSRRPPGARQRLNALLARMGRPPLPVLPPLAPVAIGGGSGYTALFTPALRRSSGAFALALFLHMFAFYFVLSWTPRLLVAAGASAQQGITGGVLLNLGGIAGGGLFGWLASRHRLERLTAGSFLLAAAGMCLFALLGARLGWAFPLTLSIGAALFGAMAGVFAIAPVVFPPELRATGLGWAIGVGRLGAILSPTTVGLLLDAGWPPVELYYLPAVSLLLAALSLLGLRRRVGGQAGG